MMTARSALQTVRRVWRELDYASRRQIELIAELPPDHPIRTRGTR